MADDNAILRLLREIRADQQDQLKRLIRVELRLGEVHESMTTALGMAAHSNVVVEQFGQRFDELETDWPRSRTALPNWNQNDG